MVHDVAAQSWGGVIGREYVAVMLPGCGDGERARLWL